MSFDLTGYVDVAERIRMFKEKYPNGSLQPLDHGKPFDVITVGEHTFVVYVAAAYRTPDDQRPGVGMAWEPYPGKSSFTRDSELMNAETSAWGRAIIATLAAETQKIASADEVRNRQVSEPAREGNVIPMPSKAAPRVDTTDSQRPFGSREAMIANAEQKSQVAKATATSVNISEAQAKLLAKLAKEKQVDLLDFIAEHTGRVVDDVGAITKKEASNVISQLMNKKEAR